MSEDIIDVYHFALLLAVVYALITAQSWTEPAKQERQVRACV